MINDGLFYYEEDLWKDGDDDDDWIEGGDDDEDHNATLTLNDSNSSLGGRDTSKLSHGGKNVNVISQEDFEKLRSSTSRTASSSSSKAPRSSSSPPRASSPPMNSSTPMKKTVPVPMAKAAERFKPKQADEKEDLEETLKARGLMMDSSSDPVPTSDINTSRRDHHNNR